MRGLLLLFVCAVMVGCGARQVDSRYITPVTSFPAEVYTDSCTARITSLGGGKYNLTSVCRDIYDDQSYYLLLLQDGVEIDRVYVPSKRTMYGPHQVEFQSPAFNGVSVYWRAVRRL